MTGHAPGYRNALTGATEGAAIMARTGHRAPGHEQTEFTRRIRVPYGKRRNRAHLADARRKPNGPPQAAGGPRGRRRPIFELAISMAGLQTLRRRVGAWMNRLGAGPIREDVVLVAHELATNVIRHGGGVGRLRMWREGSRIVCRVSDSGPGMPARVAEPESRRPGGRGLWIARRLADVRIKSGPSGTIVEAAVAL
jgi:anti-sigma regulatory factor (Ser/Thr protein kinase)